MREALLQLVERALVRFRAGGIAPLPQVGLEEQVCPERDALVAGRESGPKDLVVAEAPRHRGGARPEARDGEPPRRVTPSPGGRRAPLERR